MTWLECTRIALLATNSIIWYFCGKYVGQNQGATLTVRLRKDPP